MAQDRARTFVNLMAIGFVLICIAFGIWGFLKLWPMSIEVEISEETVQEKVTDYFAKLSNKSVRFSDVDVDLKDNERIHLSTAVELTAFGLERSGTAEISWYIEYEPLSVSVGMDRPMIESLVIEGVPAGPTSVFRTLVNGALWSYARHIPVKKLDDSVLKERAAKLVLQKVEVREDKVVLTLDNSAL